MTKGLPASGTLAEAAGRSLLDGGFRYPVAALRESALAHNVAAMAGYCAAQGVELAPHAKTTMSPELCRRQLEGGATALTVATWPQAEACWDAGFRRLVIANQLVGAPEVRWVVAAIRGDPEASIVSFVDDIATAARIGAIADAAGGVMDVALEVGYPGGRCGVRNLAEALAVAHAVTESPGLRLAGVAAYEGLIAADPGEHAVPAVDAFLEAVGATAAAVAEAGLLGEAPLLTAGGSAYFDRVVAVLGPAAAKLGARLVLRSGCYVTHDHGLYARATPSGGRAPLELFRPALELWGQVLSRPEPQRAIVGLGKRDAAFDTDWPVALGERARDGVLSRLAGVARTAALNDQHLHLEVEPSTDLRAGDLVGFGISHPCAAFDRWTRLATVDDDYRVVGVVTTMF